MARRKDQVAWTPDEEAFLRECADIGWPNSTIFAKWPPAFPRRTLGAITNRRQSLGIRTTFNPVIPQKGVPTPTPERPEQVLEVKDSGDGLSVMAFGSEVKTLAELIARAKIDLTKYEVDKPETSMHETTIRDPEGKIRKVQNFRIVARFRLKQGPSTAEQVEALIAGAFAKRVPRQVKSQGKSQGKSQVKSDLMQAVVIADPHLAKYAWGGETGWEDYDLNIGSRLLREATDALTQWGDEQRPAERHIWLLGDQLHYDNPQGHTTGGTPQDRDTRLAKMLAEAQSSFCHAIERSAATCPTKVTVIGGNHDKSLSVALQMILAAWFRHDPRVTVDLSASARKYVEWGKCLIGLTHGDTARKRLPNLMQSERREAWGRSKCAEWHHGHFHREAQTVTEGGVTIREHLALCPPDGWHAAEGYVGSPRGMDTVLYHADGYVQGWWRHTVLTG